MQLSQLREGVSSIPTASKDASLAHVQGPLTPCRPAKSLAATLAPTSS